jgi:hypothetical protein
VRQTALLFMTAPDTPREKITRDGPYHSVSQWVGVSGKVYTGTVDDGDHKPAKCRKCPTIANPAHVCDGPRGGLQVFCADHCPACIAFRNGAPGEVRTLAPQN